MTASLREGMAVRATRRRIVMCFCEHRALGLGASLYAILPEADKVIVL